MRDALALHDQILRVAIEMEGDYVFTTAGDSFAAAFDTVDAAVAAPRDVSAADFPQDATLKVRAGVHVEVADERDGDYFCRAPTLEHRSWHPGDSRSSTRLATQS
ncbi:MAG: hypothetical protein ACKVHU_08050 [Acidimicrobiales bacterium]|jgi:hypothetical protein